MEKLTRFCNKHFYRLLAVASFLFWFIETWYFGFNNTPQSNIEGALDTVAQILLFWGVIGDIAQNLNISKTVNVKAMDNYLYVDRTTEVNNQAQKENKNAS